MPLPPLFRHHFQVAYVVRDTHAAAATFANRLGIARWHVMDMVAMQGAASATRTISLAYAGELMIELIEPNLQIDSFYTGYVPVAADGARFHHLGFLIPSEEEFAATVKALDDAGFPAAAAGRAGDWIDFHYADTTALLGHYCELVHLRAAGAGFFDLVPRN